MKQSACIRLLVTSCLLVLAKYESLAQLPSSFTLNSPDGAADGLQPPYYSSTLPSFFTSANQVDALASTVHGDWREPGAALTCFSSVFRDPQTGYVGFQYKFSVSGGGALDYVLSDTDFWTHPWQGTTIVLAGADGTGHSTPGNWYTYWANGDPFSIFHRDALNGAGIGIIFNSSQQGTSIGSGDVSANIFFVTEGTKYTTTSYVGYDAANQWDPFAALAPAPEPSAISLTLVAGAVLALGLRRRAI